VSLVALGLRLAALQALAGRTVAEGRIADSRIPPVDQRAVEDRLAAIAIYTDEETGAPAGLALGQADDRALLFVLELALAEATVVEGEATVTIPSTDAGMELALDILQRQVLRVLQSDDGPWAELWRTLAQRAVKFERRRGAGMVEQGVRFAARQLIVTLQPMHEPSFGPPTGPFAQLLALMADTPDLAPLVEVLAEVIARGDLADWRIAQSDFGLTHDGVRGMGIAPVFETADEAAPTAAQLTVLGGADPLVIVPEPEDD
jgi:hypothetical protein